VPLCCDGAIKYLSDLTKRAVMLEQFRFDAIRDCYGRAAEARRSADAASDAHARLDFLEFERWLALARGFEAELGPITEQLAA
jgi:hypothetical protein